MPKLDFPGYVVEKNPSASAGTLVQSLPVGMPWSNYNCLILGTFFATCEYFHLCIYHIILKFSVYLLALQNKLKNIDIYLHVCNPII